MYDYLVAHARTSVWCTPKQDTQMIVKPARLTRWGGEWNKVEVLWRKHALPERGPRFHIYQIGQLHPALMGLFPVANEWVTLAAACKAENLIVDLYASNGAQMPRTETWYMVTPDLNLILAVKEQVEVPIDFNDEDLYFRVYSNAYFSSRESDPLVDYIDVQGGTMRTAEAILALQEQFDIAATKPGHVYAFVNGMRVNAISLVTVKPGDVAEFVYDSSIYKVLTLPVNTLSSFNSELDLKHKYLLHYPGAGERGIDFHDDIDVFLLNPQAGAFFEGVYYHRNQPDAVRMVTHKDYAIPVPYVIGYAAQHPGWSTNDLKVQLHIRKSGYLRPLVFEHQRIKELYKMSDEDVLQAMVGLDAVVPSWTASNLEKSGYTTLMRSKLINITRPLVESAYGYNAISKLLADTPVATRNVSGFQMVDVPYGLLYNSTAYEYDAQGKLLEWHTHGTGATYAAVNPNTRLVEMIAGLVGTRLDEVYGEMTQQLNPKAEYRMYTCPIEAGVPTNVFTDVTGGAQYSIENNVLTWLIDPAQVYTLVRSNEIALGYNLSLPVQSGILRFTLTHRQSRAGEIQNWTMQVPMGELDLFLNGHSLVEGVDYFVKFPEVVIVNKKFLIDQETAEQQVTVRFSGFCKADLTREPADDVGFVQYDLLSKNNRFDIRDDKVLRITVGGALYARNELEFSEDDSGVLVPDAKNGSPYQVRDLVVPLRGTAVSDTYALRAVAEAVDKSISDYMTLKVPAPVFDTPSAIPARWPVYSPFCSAIIHDLNTGVFNPETIYGFYNDQDVRDLCAPYEKWLQFDPTQLGLKPDDRFVVVHPHDLDTTIGLNAHQYKFLTRVVKLYLDNAVVLSEFVQISA